MSVTPENPLFPNPVLPKTSVLDLPEGSEVAIFSIKPRNLFNIKV